LDAGGDAALDDDLVVFLVLGPGRAEGQAQDKTHESDG